jgi:dihydroxyacetone kinase-like protein
MVAKAERGDKTLWTSGSWWRSLLRQRNPYLTAALEAACEVAEQAAQSTITMQARKGRASYLGERSIGHQDPGATSALFMVQTGCCG